MNSVRHAICNYCHIVVPLRRLAESRVELSTNSSSLTSVLKFTKRIAIYRYYNNPGNFRLQMSFPLRCAFTRVRRVSGRSQSYRVLYLITWTFSVAPIARATHHRQSIIVRSRLYLNGTASRDEVTAVLSPVPGYSYRWTGYGGATLRTGCRFNAVGY